MILLISAVFPPEPVVSASLVYDLAISLSEECKVNVLTPWPSRPLGFHFGIIPNKINRFEHIILNSYTCPKSNLFGRMLESYSFGKHASNYIRNNRAEIQGIYFIVWPLFAQYFIARIAKKYSIPTIIHVQDIYPESLTNKIPVFGNFIRKMLLPIDRYILKNVSRIIAISDNMVTILVKTRDINENKIEKIQNWQDESEFIRGKILPECQITNEFSGKQFTFMFLGNIGPVAGVDFLVETFAKESLNGVMLVIAGSGSKKDECIKIAKSFNNRNIRFWNVPMGKVPEIQEKADVMLLPVKRGAAMSSIPSKLIAYMFSGKPVIACVDEDSDTANAIKQAECGWIVPPENPDALAKTMIAAISLPVKDLQKLGRNGFKYAMENFTKKRNLHKLQTIITKTIIP